MTTRVARHEHAAPGERSSTTHRALSTRWSQAVGRPVVDEPRSWRGLLWMAYVAGMYYLLSNPLVFIPAVEVSILFASWLTFLVLLIDIRRVNRPVVSWPIVTFLVFAGISMAWSISKDDTWTTTRVSVVLALFALLVAANASTSVIAYGIAWGGVAILTLSFVAHWQQMPGADVPLGTIGTIAGVGTNRNILAYTMVPALGAALSIRPRGWLEWPVVALLVLVNGWGVKVAASSTGYVAAIVVVAVVVLLQVAVFARRWPGRRVLVGVLVLTLAAVVAVVTKGDGMAARVGRDNTLSGRRPLWDAIWDASQDRLFFGHGWGAVWGHPWHLADVNPVLESINTQIGYGAPHGHNSALDLLPELGLVGIVLLLAILGQSLACSARLAWNSTTRAGLETATLLAVLAVAQLVCGLTEPLAIAPFGWYLLALMAGVATSFTIRQRGARTSVEQDSVPASTADSGV